MIKDTGILKSVGSPAGLKKPQDGRLRAFAALLLKTMFYSKQPFDLFFFGWENESEIGLKSILKVKVNTPRSLPLCDRGFCIRGRLPVNWLQKPGSLGASLS